MFRVASPLFEGLGGKRKKGQGKGGKQAAKKRPASATAAATELGPTGSETQVPQARPKKKSKSKSEQASNEMKESSLQLLKKVMEDLGFSASSLYAWLLCYEDCLFGSLLAAGQSFPGRTRVAR